MILGWVEVGCKVVCSNTASCMRLAGWECRLYQQTCHLMWCCTELVSSRSPGIEAEWSSWSFVIRHYIPFIRYYILFFTKIMFLAVGIAKNQCNI